jgi:hypothetical protein
MIAGQASGILLGAILTTLFKGPVASWSCARASTQIKRALNEIGYCRVAMIGTNTIFRPMARVGMGHDA